MSLAEVMTPFATESPRSNDRTPPQDLLAEQCVLGAMLISKDAIADVVEVLRANDFYRPAHEQVFDAILDLYGRGEPADAITVASELTKRGEIGRMGGAPYLHTLLASVPVAANAGYYAEIVREKAILRRLVDASIRIGQMSYAAEGDVDEIVDRAQAEVYNVTERRASEDYKPLSELMQPTLDEIEAIGSRGGQLAGVPTGFLELDDLTNGLHSGQLIIVAARPGAGKALALETPLPTPSGWTTMGDVRVGDELIGADGRPTRVVAATDVLSDRDCFEITFSDGTSVVADGQHQWQASSRASRRAAAGRHPSSYYIERSRIDRVIELAVTAEDDRFASMAELVDELGLEFRHVLHSVGREVGAAVAVSAMAGNGSYASRPRVVYSRARMLVSLAARVAKPVNSWHAAEHQSIVTTAEMAKNVRLGDGRSNWAVEMAAPLQSCESPLPLAPYALGVWLGDGHSAGARFTSVDPEIAETMSAIGLILDAQSHVTYSIRMPEKSTTAKSCAVCRAVFVPARVDVRTCGRQCGGKARLTSGPAPQPRCPDCGQPYAGGCRCRDCHSADGTVQAVLRSLQVLNNKHIPGPYLRASEGQRRALLAGLLDTDGTVGANGEVQFVATNKRVADDVYELVVSLGYRCNMSTKRVLGRNESTPTAYCVNFSATQDVFWLTRKAARHRAERAENRSRAKHRYITAITPVDSVPVRCVQVDNADHLYLATRAMVPTHNSTLALDLARSASIKNGLCSAIFSLEMSQIEITMRLLSAEATIPLNHIRNGKMSDDDWQRMARKMGEVSEAPLFIDDSPNLTMMEIRAKARRLRQRHDLKLVVIDYIQLMTSGKRVESRQLEVSEFSRQLKLLAKELEVPVVALSQLNRGPEQRTDKKPMLSDLRESGCLTADTRLLRADTGAEVSMGELFASDTRNIPVWSLDDKHRLVARNMTHVFPSGVKEVFRLRLTSGREIKATANHPFRTYDGWMPLGQLVPGSRIASPRRLPEPLDLQTWDEDEVTLLAHLLGDGSFVKRQPIRYASVDEANLAAVAEAARRRFGITGVRDEYAAARVTTLRLPAPYRLTHGKRNPIAAWLDDLGLLGLRGYEMFIPGSVSRMPTDQIRSFIKHLWATDGSLRWDQKAHQGRIYYASTSRRLVDDLARLLLRCDIFARIKTVKKAGYRDGYELYVSGSENQLRFCDEIGVHGLRGEKAREVAEHLRIVRTNTNLDTVSGEVWGRVRRALVEQQITHRQFATATGTQFCGSTGWKHAPSRSRLAKVAELLDDDEMSSASTGDLFWDSVESIESLGEQEVYDATVLGTHNFMADGIAVHNSLEQDADIVILLNRPDLYDKESERAGEADMDVAKHRNGPTKLITVAFQGHYSRFTDMQH